MATFIYRCPVTGRNVQGFVADRPTADQTETFESMTCTACTRVHLVNPKTGKMLGLIEKLGSGTAALTRPPAGGESGPRGRA